MTGNARRSNRRSQVDQQPQQQQQPQPQPQPQQQQHQQQQLPQQQGLLPQQPLPPQPSHQQGQQQQLPQQDQLAPHPGQQHVHQQQLPQPGQQHLHQQQGQQQQLAQQTLLPQPSHQQGQQQQLPQQDQLAPHPGQQHVHQPQLPQPGQQHLHQQQGQQQQLAQQPLISQPGQQHLYQHQGQQQQQLLPQQSLPLQQGVLPLQQGVLPLQQGYLLPQQQIEYLRQHNFIQQNQNVGQGLNLSDNKSHLLMPTGSRSQNFQGHAQSTLQYQNTNNLHQNTNFQHPAVQVDQGLPSANIVSQIQSFQTGQGQALSADDAAYLIKFIAQQAQAIQVPAHAAVGNQSYNPRSFFMQNQRFFQHQLTSVQQQRGNARQWLGESSKQQNNASEGLANEHVKKKKLEDEVETWKAKYYSLVDINKKINKTNEIVKNKNKKLGQQVDQLQDMLDSEKSRSRNRRREVRKRDTSSSSASSSSSRSRDRNGSPSRDKKSSSNGKSKKRM